jgi:hypothetical protein
MTGEFPPGEHSNLAAQYRVTRNMHIAHERAYAALNVVTVRPSVCPPQFLLPAARKRRDASRRAAASGDRPVARGRPLKRIVEATPTSSASLPGASCAFDPRQPQHQFVRRFNPPGPLTEMGFVSDPSWMRGVLQELNYAKPVYIQRTDWRRRTTPAGRYLAEVLTQC